MISFSMTIGMLVVEILDAMIITTLISVIIVVVIKTVAANIVTFKNFDT